MAKIDLSICIPSRQEMFLTHTINDALKNIRGNTEIIVGLDGNWPDTPIVDHPKVHIIHHSVSIGQRAICNEMVRYSRAKYIAKVDAHCSFSEGFDVQLMNDMQPEWCMVPIMRNLHAFNFLCRNGHRRYQGEAGPCKECGEPTEREIVWIAKGNPQSTLYCVDPTPHFQYNNERKNHPDYKKDQKETKLTETMSLQGSFFLMEKQRYIDLNINDEEFGSWGSEGWEVAAKVWTSGGRVVCSHKSYYGHMFRTHGGQEWGFPYEISGRQVERAKKRAKKLFFESKWGPLQIHPLSWLVEKFWPLQFWTDTDLKSLKAAETAFFDHDLKLFRVLGVVPPVPIPVTDHAPSVSTTINRGEQVSIFAMDQFPLPGDDLFGNTGISCDGTSPPLPISSTDATNSEGSRVGEITGRRQEVSVGAVGLSPVDRGNSIGGSEVFNLQGQLQMKGIATRRVITDNVLKDGDTRTITHRDRTNKPSIDESMDTESLVVSDNSTETGKEDLSIPVFVKTTHPKPTPSMFFDSDLRKKAFDNSCRKGRNSEIIGVSHDSSSGDGLGLGVERCDEHRSIPNILPQSKTLSKGLLFYTDNKLDPTILSAVQKQLSLCLNGHRLVSVSLKPMNFGENIVLDLQRGHLAMAKQQLAGLEALNTDIVFMVEHDILYPPCHFEFVPPRKDVFYYDLNWWKVRESDGQALHFKAKQVSGLCAYREILIEYYRNRVRMIESGEIGGRRHFEPGGHHRDAYNKLTDKGFDTWWSEIPYVDIRHDKVITRNIFDQSGYRGQVVDWTLQDFIPGGWGVTKGRFQEWLQEVSSSNFNLK